MYSVCVRTEAASLMKFISAVENVFFVIHCVKHNRKKIHKLYTFFEYLLKH
jgi:hypothetical protein